MSIQENYREQSCYINLSEVHRNCLNRLIESYAEMLNAPIHVGESLYTLHDFNHHCYDLYQIVSGSLCRTEVSSTNPEKLTEHELFLLDVAILFHDYSMSSIVNLRVNRGKHAKLSAEFIKREWGDRSSPLYKIGQNAGMSINDINAIAEIIKAHSDEKGPDAPKMTGINAPSLKEEMPSSTGPVRAKLLAGILRMADELDITSNRLGDECLADQLNSDIPENRESLEHWNRLHYFSQVVLDNEIKNQLNLIVDDEAVSDAKRRGDDASALAAISKTGKKIREEWSQINDKIIRRTDGGPVIVRISTIRVISELDFVQSYLDDSEDDFIVHDLPRGGIDLPAKGKAAIIDEPSQQIGQMNCNRIEVISHEAKERMDEFIKRQRLLVPGHFLMTDQYCARDWIDTNKIIKEPIVYDLCISSIIYHIRAKHDLTDTVILGIDFNGTLIGAAVAAMLRCPFAFLIPPHVRESSNAPDNQIDISKFKNAILITDVIATATTERDIIERKALTGKILGIYAFLYRIPHCGGKDITPLCNAPIYCISDTFGMEVVKKADCEWKNDDLCIACNKIIK